MFISKTLAGSITTYASSYIGRPYDFDAFNCIHFVRQVYGNVGINFPLLDKRLFPPELFHLTPANFCLMPIGHSVFFKKRKSTLSRTWTHVAIIFSDSELIHCSRGFGQVVITSVRDFLEVYDLSVKPVCV
jgi:cell wall-associated NlpC family hydrolase